MTTPWDDQVTICTDGTASTSNYPCPAVITIFPGNQLPPAQPPISPLNATITFLKTEAIPITTPDNITWDEVDFNVGTPFVRSTTDASVLICQRAGIYQVQWNVQAANTSLVVPNDYSVLSFLVDVFSLTSIPTATAVQGFHPTVAGQVYTITGFGRIRLATDDTVALMLLPSVPTLQTVNVTDGVQNVSAYLTFTLVG